MTLLADFTIASENAFFSAPEIRHISAPTFVLPFMIGMKKTKEFLLTGNRLSAKEAEEIGIVTRVVPDDKLEETVDELAHELASIPPLSLALNKVAINKAYEILGFKSAIDYGVEILTMLLSRSISGSGFPPPPPSGTGSSVASSSAREISICACTSTR